MPKTKVFIELRDSRPDDRRITQCILNGLRTTFGHQCTDLDCEVARASPTPLSSDISETIRTTHKQVKVSLSQSDAEWCVYVTPRNLIINFPDQTRQQTIVYVVAMANRKGILWTSLDSNPATDLPPEVTIKLGEAMVKAGVEDTMDFADVEEEAVVRRLHEAFLEGVSLSIELTARRKRDIN